MRIKRTLGVIAAATMIMVTGCGNAVDENVEKENTPAQESSVPVEPTESASDEQLEEPAAEADSDYRVVSGGPYGQISLFVPDGWEYIVCPVDDDQMSYGLYGFILKPLEASEGQIELFCSDSFGACGTGLKQEEMTLAGETAHVGTYDEHEHWDFITFGSDSPQIVAQSIGYGGFHQLKSLQVMGLASMIEPFTEEYLKIMEYKKIPVEAMKQLPMPMNLIKIVPESYDLLDSDLKKDGFGNRQHLDV